MLKYIPLPYLRPTLIKRVLDKIDKSAGPDGCWPWTASTDAHGYGKIKISGTTFRAHRLAYFIATGIDPRDQMVCHRCDNPPCCNDAHHFLGDNSANILDCIAKGRMPVKIADGERNAAAKLTDADVEKVREMIRTGSTNMAIGRVFGVTHQCISRIRRGRAWGSEPMQPKYASLRR